MTLGRRPILVAVVLWAAVAAASLTLRPPLPIDETRYLSVAWEMWSAGDFLVPRLNAEPYSHKPPLLFWLMQAGWAAVGVAEWWARLVPPLAGLGTMFGAGRLAALLWPDRPGIAASAPLALIGCGGFAVVSTMTNFDTLLALTVVIGLIGLAMIGRAAMAPGSSARGPRAQGSRTRGWTLFALGLGLGVLAKGPVVLLHLLPAALLAPVWMPAPERGWRRHYGGLALAVLGGAALALLWAVPAGIAGGPEYRDAIFWGQTAGRVVDSFAHDRPFWWYLPLLPVALFPWIWWPAPWRMLGQGAPPGDRMGLKFLACSGGVGFVALSLVSGKGPHYLTPLMPAAALLIAYALVRAGDGGPRRWYLWSVAAVMLTLAGLVEGLAWAPRGWAPRAWLDGIVHFPGDGGLGAASTAGAAALAAGAGAIFLCRRWPPARQALVLASVAPLLIVTVLGVFQAVFRPYYDLHPIARYLAAVERQGRPIGHMGDYKGQYDFLGRMTGTMELLTHDSQVPPWLARNPNGALVAIQDRLQTVYDDAPEFIQPYRNRYIAVWSAEVLARRAHVIVDF
jgi:4-amino-4-deoxy-L-arabinose transferase-like glycosyltransferase